MKKSIIASALLLAGQLVLSSCAPGAVSTTSAGTSAGTSAATSAGTSAGTAAGTTGSTQGATPTTVKVGVIGSKHELWDKIKENLAAESIEIELVEFTDYNTPNEALSSGDLDLNSFQHHIFLDTYNKEKGNKLVPIGDTFLSPIGLYSEKYKTPDEIKDGDTIAIPDDPTNLGRALKVLEAAGLIKLKDASNLTPTQEDIAENLRSLTITELDAAQTARSLQDVAAAIINTDLAVDAGFSPADDAIFLEPVTEASKPYHNLIAARVEDKENPIYKRIVEEYQTQKIGDLMIEVYKGAQFPVWEGYQKK